MTYQRGNVNTHKDQDTVEHNTLSQLVKSRALQVQSAVWACGVWPVPCTVSN